jgi:chromosome partitioning protein
LPKAYDAGVPVFELTDKEIAETGPVLEGMRARREVFSEQFAALSTTLVAILSNV